MRDRPSIIPHNDLVPCVGVCCMVSSLFTQYPQCLGCYRQYDCLCCYFDQVCMKPSEEDGFCCDCHSMQCLLGNCKFCCTVSILFLHVVECAYLVKKISLLFVVLLHSLFSVMSFSRIRSCIVGRRMFLPTSLFIIAK